MVRRVWWSKIAHFMVSRKQREAQERIRSRHAPSDLLPPIRNPTSLTNFHHLPITPSNYIPSRDESIDESEPS
jgi:hypothetical protein